MRFEINFQQDEGFIYVESEGVMYPEDSKNVREAVIQYIQDHNCKKVLINHAQLKAVQLSVIDISNLPSNYEEIGLSRSVKIAMLPPANEYESFRFYEYVSKNGGFIVRLFNNKQDAVEWLKTE